MLALFAQAARNRNGINNLNGNNNLNNMPPEVLIGILVFVVVVVLIWLIVAIFFLLTLSKALSRCRPRNRAMEPGQVWLNLIPIFNLVWQFITVNRIAQSLRREFRSRRWSSKDDFGQSLGTAYCVLNIVSAIPYLGGCFGLAGLVCFIIYWVKIAGYSSQLITREEYDEYEDDRRDDDHDRRHDDDDDDYDRRHDDDDDHDRTGDRDRRR